MPGRRCGFDLVAGGPLRRNALVTWYTERWPAVFKHLYPTGCPSSEGGPGRVSIVWSRYSTLLRDRRRRPILGGSARRVDATLGMA